jgi:hypothetical protein
LSLPQPLSCLPVATLSADRTLAPELPRSRLGSASIGLACFPPSAVSSVDSASEDLSSPCASFCTAPEQGCDAASAPFRPAPSANGRPYRRLGCFPAPPQVCTEKGCRCNLQGEKWKQPARMDRAPATSPQGK